MHVPDKSGQIASVDTNNDDKIDIYYNNSSCPAHIWYKWVLDVTNCSNNCRRQWN